MSPIPSAIAIAMLVPVCHAVLAEEAATLVGPYDPDDHTLLLYHFDEEGDQVVDSSAQGLHGRLNQGPVERGEGIFGSSLKLAEGQWVQLESDREALRGMGELTAELWLKTTRQDRSRPQQIVVFPQHYLISIEGGVVWGRLYNRQGGVMERKSDTRVVPDVWYHVALTFNGTSGTLWVNSRQEATKEFRGPISDTGGSLTVSSPSGDGFIGEIDELRISKVARPRFLAARQRHHAHPVNQLGLSPGAFRLSFSPVLPPGATDIVCSATLEGGGTETISLAGDALKPVNGQAWLEGSAELVVPVPAGLEGPRLISCTTAYAVQGRQVTASQRLAVRIEPMVPPPAKEFRAAWTHSHAIQNPDDLFARMAAGGLNAAIMRVRRGETAYYKSKVGPLSIVPFDNEHLLEDCLAAAEKHGIDLHAYVNCFNLGQPDSEYAQQLRAEGRWQKSWQGEDYPYLCPSEPANVELVKQGMLELVRDYPIKGIQYDFIRYPGGGECFCERCRRKFEERIGKAVEHWPADVRSQGPLEAPWLEVRAEHVTEAVREITAAIRHTRPEVMVTAAVFDYPPQTAIRNVGQDWLRWAQEGLVDALCPMSYCYDLTDYETIVGMILRAVDGAVPVYAGIGVTAGGQMMRYPEELAAKLNILRRLGANGFAMFSVTPPSQAPENILIPLRSSALAGDGRG